MIHKTANLYPSAQVDSTSKVGAFAEIGHKVIIGKNCSIGFGAFIPENVEIGDNVFIGPGVVFTNDKYAPSKGKWRKDPPTKVQNNVTIGANSTILPSLTIGANSRIGAGSVLTKNLPNNSVAYGNPAKCQ